MNVSAEAVITEQSISSLIYKVSLIKGKANGSAQPDSKLILNAVISRYLMTTQRITLGIDNVDEKLGSIIGNCPGLIQYMIDTKWGLIRLTTHAYEACKCKSIERVLEGYFNKYTKLNIFTSSEACCSASALNIDFILFLQPDSR